MVLKAKEDGIDFKIVFVDTRRSNLISSEIEFISRLGIPVMYTYLNGVSNVIGKVTKVFIKAKSMLANGFLKGKLGTALLACIAHSFKKPVIAFCQTFKFLDKIMLNSFNGNQSGQINNINYLVNKAGNSGFKEITLDYDITPASYINMVICEFGYIPSTSVPVLIREFGRKEIEFKIEH